MASLTSLQSPRKVKQVSTLAVEDLNMGIGKACATLLLQAFHDISWWNTTGNRKTKQIQLLNPMAPKFSSILRERPLSNNLGAFIAVFWQLQHFRVIS